MKSYLYISVAVMALLASCKNKTAKTQIIKKTPTTLTKEIQTQHQASTENMILFEAGTFTMGNNQGSNKEAPEHIEKVSAFYLDKNPVTVREFRTFIKETQFKTDAEKFGDSGVFSFEKQQWELLPGTTWEYPLGPNKGKAKDNHPVTHVSWNDAIAYCNWAGKRLPTEIEWEYAAKNGGKQTRFPWGDELKPNNKWVCNVFQGTIAKPLEEDGFLFTSPVGAFGESKSGLTDMSGNVWEWTNDTYAPYTGNQEQVRIDETIKVTRGGSFMYDEAGEMSYTTTFRASNTVETSLFNSGFRCALSAQ